MDCPFCGIKMIPGYIQSARTVFFTENPHTLFFMPDKRDLTLTEHNWTRPTCLAHRCPNCNKIIIDPDAK